MARNITPGAGRFGAVRCGAVRMWMWMWVRVRLRVRLRVRVRVRM